MKLLLIEDDHAIRKMFAAALVAEGYEVVEAATGEIGVELIDAHPVDIAIIDLRLPGISGFEVVRALRIKSKIPLVILTAQGDSHDVVAGLEAGADDFLMKPIAPKELAARLRAILRRVNHPETETDQVREIVVGRITIKPTAHDVFIDGTAVGFTRTEFKVLVKLGSVSPNTVTRADLLDEVWGYDYLGDTRLVDMQIYRIRAKLEPHGLADNLLTVRGVGFKILP